MRRSRKGEPPIVRNTKNDWLKALLETDPFLSQLTADGIERRTGRRPDMPFTKRKGEL